jgi:hypothetical protein
MRNEKLFNNLDGNPNQVIIRTNSLLGSLQLHNSPVMTTKSPSTPQELLYSGPKIFVDAAWKKQANGQPTKAGVGIYITWKNGQHTTDVFISTKTSPVSIPIQAEAEGLLVAANITSSLLLLDLFFFTDNLSLAKAVQAQGVADPIVLWEIRRHAVQFQEKMQPLRPQITHISRSFNIVAHNCAQQAKTLSRTLPICSCMNSTHSSTTLPLLKKKDLYALVAVSRVGSRPKDESIAVLMRSRDLCVIYKKILPKN